MKKKLGAILMAGVMSVSVVAGLAFSACGSTQKADFVMPEGGFDFDKQVTITFYHTMGSDYRKVLDDAIEDFNLLYPNIKVDTLMAGGYTDLADRLYTEVSAGNQPDLAYCYPDHVAVYNVSGAVQSLNDFLVDGAYSDVTVTQVKLENGKQVLNEDGSYVTEQVPLNLTQEQTDAFIEVYYNEGYEFGDGTKMYMMPFSKSTEILYYNKTLFEENNIKVPTTWAEMETACAKIMEINAATNKDMIPFGYDDESNWFITMCEQYGSEYTSLDENKPFLFDNETNRSFVKMFAEWYKKGYFTTKSLNGNQYTSNLFKEAKTAMSIGSSAGASNQMPVATDGTVPFEVGIAPIPQVDVNNPKSISQGPSVCIFKQNDPQRVLASWLFVKYLLTNVEFQALFSNVGGYMPVLNYEAMSTNAAYKNIIDSADPTGEMSAANVSAIAAKLSMDMVDQYYTSPAFYGSAKAREMVGQLMTRAFTNYQKNGDLDGAVNEAFKYAMEECEYVVS